MTRRKKPESGARSTPKKKVAKRKAVKKKAAKRKTRPKTQARQNPDHPGGRPPLYDDPAVMQAKIDEYFAFCDNRIKTVDIDDDGNAKTAVVPEPYTIAGLTYFLGFCDVHALSEYEKRDGFSALIKRAKLKVQQDVERKLWEGKSPTGSIFWLKNHAGYRDKSEHEHTGKDGGPVAMSIKVSVDGKGIILGGKAPFSQDDSTPE